jgi:hypothetical protein
METMINHSFVRLKPVFWLSSAGRSMPLPGRVANPSLDKTTTGLPLRLFAVRSRGRWASDDLTLRAQ